MKELSIHELYAVSGGVSVFGLSTAQSAMAINATMSASTYTVGTLLAGNNPTVGGVLGNAASGAVLGSRTNPLTWRNVGKVNGASAIALGVEAAYNRGIQKIEDALAAAGV